MPKPCPTEVALAQDQADRLLAERGGEPGLEPVYRCDLWGAHRVHVSFVQGFGPRKGVWARWSAARRVNLVWGINCHVGDEYKADDDPFCVLWDGHAGPHFVARPGTHA